MTLSGTPQGREQTALLTIQQLAEMLNCSTRHLYRLVDRSAAPRPVRLGNLLRFRRDDIETWIRDGCPSVGQAEGAR